MRIRRRKSDKVKEELKKRIARSKEAFEELDAKGLERTWRDLNDVYVFF
jgi:hypothetical protein